jgi:hypothetical protein
LTTYCADTSGLTPHSFVQIGCLQFDDRKIISGAADKTIKGLSLPPWSSVLTWPGFQFGILPRCNVGTPLRDTKALSAVFSLTSSGLCRAHGTITSRYSWPSFFTRRTAHSSSSAVGCANLQMYRYTARTHEQAYVPAV